MRVPIKDHNSRLIGWRRIMPNGDIEMYDQNNHLLGKVTANGTFGRNHQLISRSREPGLLLCGACF